MSLKDKFDNLSREQQVSIWNDFADANSYNRIFSNDSDTIDSLFERPSDLLSALDGAYYYLDDDYFLINDYRTLETFTCIEDCSEFDWSALEKWLISEEYNLDNL